MSWIKYALLIAMIIVAIIFHEKFKNSKFLNNNLLKLIYLAYYYICISASNDLYFQR